MSGGRTKRKAGPSRVILDTGVLLQALLLSNARAKHLREAWQGGACVPLVAPDTAQALMRTLAYPGLKLSKAQQHELLADFLPYAEVAADARVRAGRAQEPVLRLALSSEARADYLVSDDKPLAATFARAVSRTEKRNCKLVGVDEFLVKLGV